MKPVEVCNQLDRPVSCAECGYPIPVGALCWSTSRAWVYAWCKLKCFETAVQLGKVKEEGSYDDEQEGRDRRCNL